ncbi:MAG: hypothetical protein KIS66_18050 [Fimbriimonadaceae bacterium]|nr:hypothetical protein [Fimbriimonadaceae bacterium]
MGVPIQMSNPTDDKYRWFRQKLLAAFPVQLPDTERNPEIRNKVLDMQKPWDQIELAEKNCMFAEELDELDAEWKRYYLPCYLWNAIEEDEYQQSFVSDMLWQGRKRSVAHLMASLSTEQRSCVRDFVDIVRSQILNVDPSHQRYMAFSLDHLDRIDAYLDRFDPPRPQILQGRS